ncbi:MAG: CRISPR-associated endonuclease Cas2 [Candidatus Odinarchaeia archaeon]
MYTIIVYDVSVNRVNKIRKYLKQFLNWVQNSAFEGELKTAEIEKIKIELKKMINQSEDSILIYKIPYKKMLTKEIIGIEKNQLTTII